MMKPYTTLLRYLRERHIEYHCQNYLTLEGNALFDVVTLIYCDFWILPPADRTELLRRIRHVLETELISTGTGYTPESETICAVARME